MPNKSILLLGSNIGDKILNLQTAINLLQNQVNVLAQSGYYKTAAWGNTEQDFFINQAILIETDLTVTALLQFVLATEIQMGRVREIKWQARNIDIDIIYFNSEIVQSKDLIVPHPHLQLRRFVLEPMVEIAPNWRHPILQKTNTELLAICPDNLNVEKL